MSPNPSPAETYRRELDRFEERSTGLRQVSRRLSWARLLVVGALLGLAWPALFGDTIGALWLLLPAAGFVALAVAHEGIEKRRRHADRAAEIYRRGLARLAGDWIGHGADGARFADAAHPYTSDLDLFGAGSVFEYLCAARTADGEARLAAWLGQAADAATIRGRQHAVDELRDRGDLRLDLALLGDRVGSTVDTAALLRWATSAPALTARWPRWIAMLLGIANVATLTAWMAPALQQSIDAAQGGEVFEPFAGSLPFILSLAASGLMSLLHGARVAHVLHDADRPQHDLELLAGLLGRLENESFECEELRAFAGGLRAEGAPPSRVIARLTRLAQIEQSRLNHIFNALGGLVFAGTHLAYEMERWRKRYGEAVGVWVDTVARFEALSSLARYAHENPEDVFPEIVEGPASFEAKGLAHPLLGAATAVRNDVKLAREGQRLWIVSGSNMAGKSTLLRTTGVNTVLALAGAPVRAREMRLTPLALGASMRIVDSLREGASHLYAEIRRLRAIVDLCAGPLPVLFLLDEVLHGTNSSDRRAGAAAVLRTLLDAGAVGMVTTHDLALARIVEELGDAGANVHFVDHMQDGELAFDYKLRPGPVQKGNALELMRAIGLDV